MSVAPATPAEPETRGADLALTNLTVRRGEAAVLSGINLTVEPGELVVVIGPSGSGKSTLLSAIAGLVPTSAGRVEIDGKDVARLPRHEVARRIGYCFQGLGLFPHMTVAQNVGITLDLLGWHPARSAARVDALLDAVALDPKSHRERMPDQLSGGQAQRVAVARALAAEPPLLLLDEPFGALDPEIRARLQDELLSLHRRIGVTTLLVSHDLGEALLLGGRLLVLIDGKVAQLGTPAEVVANPASDAVRALLAPALERASSVAALRSP